MIGEFNHWNGDIFMTQDMVNPDLWSASLTVTAADDMNGNGTVEMKFRQGASWTTNWGDDTFPSGYGYQGGPNIPVDFGTYIVTFNRANGEYNFAIPPPPPPPVPVSNWAIILGIFLIAVFMVFRFRRRMA
jgi:hypothetical protein